MHAGEDHSKRAYLHSASSQACCCSVPYGMCPLLLPSLCICLAWACMYSLLDSRILSMVPTCALLSAPCQCPAALYRQVGFQTSGLTHPKTRPPGSDLCYDLVPSIFGRGYGKNHCVGWRILLSCLKECIWLIRPVSVFAIATATTFF